ncbi:ABC transporter permease subunit [Mycolicibacterium parafortuitum]|uniref:Inner membrane ABC transporter permease protein YjfF [Actinoplanes friuliensis DSM 7358] n=1 Tax=Mycolicibacterium parafortuitum TaxID=39692 RepID=A0A375YI89_MYCPF|nr:sugar ABC transporter permease YjfF [Mycolicibacterium parafortuitum]ORB32178.1 sugar ABC transporter permease YjfF [Mycolicibacterium parafortuitum]SRX80855.1 inner membrane ABC transporter permease protein YjfF [Actinoplanes friuliensis DSM 7358] [Mycolicibacterium parafortuitum]
MSATTPALDAPRDDRWQSLTGEVLARFRGRYLSPLASLGLLALMFGAIVVRYDFASPTQVFLNLFVDNAYLIVLAVGMTFVILSGGIDLSVGSTVALSTVIVATALQQGWPMPLAVGTVLVVGPLLGWLMGLVIEYFDVQPFIVTLAGMFLARGLCYVISVDTLPIKDPVLRRIGLNYVYLYEDKFIRWTVVIAVAVVVIAAFTLHQTRYGRTVYAVGGNRQSTQLMGLAAARARVSVYAVSGFCAALAGLLLAVQKLSGYSLNGIGMELDAIAAAVIGGVLLSGGTGFVFGSVIGVLVLGTIQTFVTAENLDSYWTRIMTGVLLLVFVLVQRLVVRKPR